MCSKLDLSNFWLRLPESLVGTCLMSSSCVWFVTDGSWHSYTLEMTQWSHCLPGSLYLGGGLLSLGNPAPAGHGALSHLSLFQLLPRAHSALPQLLPVDHTGTKPELIKGKQDRRHSDVNASWAPAVPSAGMLFLPHSLEQLLPRKSFLPWPPSLCLVTLLHACVGWSLVFRVHGSVLNNACMNVCDYCLSPLLGCKLCEGQEHVCGCSSHHPSVLPYLTLWWLGSPEHC